QGKGQRVHAVGSVAGARAARQGFAEKWVLPMGLRTLAKRSHTAPTSSGAGLARLAARHADDSSEDNEARDCCPLAPRAGPIPTPPFAPRRAKNPLTRGRPSSTLHGTTLSRLATRPHVPDGKAAARFRPFPKGGCAWRREF